MWIEVWDNEKVVQRFSIGDADTIIFDREAGVMYKRFGGLERPVWTELEWQIAAGDMRYATHIMAGPDDSSGITAPIEVVGATVYGSSRFGSANPDYCVTHPPEVADEHYAEPASKVLPHGTFLSPFLASQGYTVAPTPAAISERSHLSVAERGGCDAHCMTEDYFNAHCPGSPCQVTVLNARAPYA